MKLSTLADEIVGVDPDILGLTADSRAVKPGFLFAALPGVTADGTRFIPQAEENGAAAILAKPGTVSRSPIIADENPRARFAHMAARFFARQPEIVAGVTGTNGKTSTAIFAAQLWTLLGHQGGSIGTLGAQGGGLTLETTLTTPDPVSLHQLLAQLSEAGVDRLAMEVSSHAIAQSRADGVRLSVAAFTNITQDHLDYHASFEEYFAAKQRLISECLDDDGIAVINADGAGAADMRDAAAARGLAVITTGKKGRDLSLRDARPTAKGIALEIVAGGRCYSVTLPAIGLFQAENALLAAGIVMAAGALADDVLPLIEKLQGVPGRMQHATDINGAALYVDYAHTPDAVATALQAIRPHAAGRVIAIIGAGGDRDAGKRPLMGAAASDNADLVIVTDDNPRSEDAASIRAMILSGAPDAIDIGDRRAAIETGVSLLAPGDILLIAGKGHERGQQVGDKVLPFDDVEEARQAVMRFGSR